MGADAVQADALDEERGSSGAGAKSAGAGPLPDIRACLRPVGVMEARYVRVLSSLCALTYHLDNLTVGAAGDVRASPGAIASWRVGLLQRQPWPCLLRVRTENRHVSARTWDGL